MTIRPTIRLRLTLLYGGLFFIAGLLLLGGTYQLITTALPVGDLQRQVTRLQRANPTGPQYSLLQTQLRERRQALRAVREKARITLIVVTLGAVGLGWFVAGQVLAPIQQITAHAQRASSATLGERIALRGPPDELHELADTFDSMLDRLQAAFESQRQFTGQVSHELRTPLAIMQTAADVALADPAATAREHDLATLIRASVARSERLIGGLLTLSRSESTLLETARIDLADVAGHSLAEAARAAGEAGITIEECELAPAVICGDPLLMERLCDNLIDNAIRHNVPHGWLRVTTGTAGALDQPRTHRPVELTVENSGPRIDGARVDSLFLPFQRGTQAAGRDATDVAGFGLGLAIVRAVTTAHQGTIDAAPLPEGGLTITIRFREPVS